MPRMTIDLPNSLHKTLKFLSAANEISMKNIAITAIEKYASIIVEQSQRSFSKKDFSKALKEVLDKYIEKFETGKISDEEFDCFFEKVKEYLTEEEEHRLLLPYLKKMITSVENGEGVTWDELKKNITESEE